MITIVFVYLVSVIVLSIFVGKKLKSPDDFFFSSSKLNSTLSAFSILATMISSISYLGNPSEVMKNGLGFFLGGIFGVVGYTWVIAHFVSPRLHSFKSKTPYAYLEERFSPSTRRYGVILGMIYIALWTGVILVTTSDLVSQLFRQDGLVVLLCLGAFSVLYTTIGGFLADVVTDFIQALFMIGGGILILTVIAIHTHSSPLEWPHFWAEKTGYFRDSHYFNFQNGNFLAQFSRQFLWGLCTFTGSQLVTQRFTAVGGQRAVKSTIVKFVALNILMKVLLNFTGFALFYFYSQGAAEIPAGVDLATGMGTEKLVGDFIHHQLNPYISGGILAAILAAAMSSIDSSVNSFAALIHYEFFPKQTQLVQMRRISFVVGIAFVMTAVFIFQTPRHLGIIELSDRTFNFFVGPLGILFFSGFLFKRIQSRDLVLSSVVAMSVGLGFVRSGLYNWVIASSFVAGMGVSALQNFIRKKGLARV